MDRRNLRAVLRHAAAVAGRAPLAAGDAELLDRFRRDRDEVAFAELVRRHGRLVWAVCRNLLPTDSDAEDAFQATFLVLVRSAATLHDDGKLAPFLHGVAFRICSKARRTVARRKKLERSAGSLVAGRAVPDSAWDAALVAVHEEIARLPETLRVPFVLCCLEGLGATEAAGKLGWKLGTLSGRLTRAKQALLKRLEARELSAGAVAAVLVTGGAAGAALPVPVAERAIELVTAGTTIPSTVLSLSQGVVGMTIHRTKLLAASFLLIGGLTASGSGWLATAEAQAPKKTAKASEEKKSGAQNDPQTRDHLDTLRLRYEVQLRQLEQAKLAQQVREMLLKVENAKDQATMKPAAQWQYRYLPQAVAYGFKQADFESTIADNEKQGWDFVGVVTMQWAGDQGGTPPEKGAKSLPTLVFRKPAGTADSGFGNQTSRLLLDADIARLRASEALQAETFKKKENAEGDNRQVVELRDQIAVLQARIAELQKGQRNQTEAFIAAKELGGINPKEFQTLLHSLAHVGFGYDGKKQFASEAHENGVIVRGHPDNVKWAQDLVKKLTGK